jgi:hypothetical protein
LVTKAGRKRKKRVNAEDEKRRRRGCAEKRRTDEGRKAKDEKDPARCDE